MRTSRRPYGFSLVELLIAVMILGIGMILIAGAFPVGLAYHRRSVEDTTAGLCARSAISRLTLLRTHDGHEEFYNSDTGYEEAHGQMAVVECFSESTSGSVRVKYLFEKDSSGNPTHDKTTSGGKILYEAKLGEDIDDWLPEQERAYESDRRYAYQILYQRIPDPGSGQISGSTTYLAYVAVQHADDDRAAATFAQRFPPASGLIKVTGVNGKEITLETSHATVPGARLVDCHTGQWYEVLEAKGRELTLTRSPENLSQHEVRIVNHAVAVFAAVVSKQHIR